MKHLYTITILKGLDEDEDVIQQEAFSESQARFLAESMGYTVLSMEESIVHEKRDKGSSI